MKRRVLVILSLAAFVACAQTITTRSIPADSVPKVSYDAYIYSSGAGERLRAVFLKSADAGVEVVPYSVQIKTGALRFEEALGFVERGGYRNASVSAVSYRGKPIGYLLSQGYTTFKKEAIEIDLFERGGKVYFSVKEKTYND